MNEHDALRERLASLRDSDPPGHLRARIERARKRRNRRLGLAGSALVGVMAVVALSWQPLVQSPQSPTARSAAAGPADVEAADAQLRALDRQLQAAYRANASERRIAELWELRRMLLANREGGSARPIRI